MNTFLTIVFILMIIVPVILFCVQKKNLNYYKLHGRSRVEIESWLKTRPWYTTYRAEVFSDILNDFKSINDRAPEDHEIDIMMEKLDSIVRGAYDKNTISGAFPWTATEEGQKVWARRQYSFLKWYFGQYVDFHLISSKI